MRAIYSITNVTNDKKYIGETMDVKRRWEEHEEDLENNQHHSYKLQQDWNKYGKDKFKFEIVAVLDESISNYIDKYILLLYEGYYIKEYDSIENGYNVENTLIEIMNDRKTIFSYKDKGILKTCYKRIEKGEIVIKGNLIFQGQLITFKDLCEKLDKNTRYVRKLMVQENIIFKNDKKYSLTEKYKSNENIILEDDNNVQKMIFTVEGFQEIYEKLKDVNIKHNEITKEKTQSKQNNNTEVVKKEIKYIHDTNNDSVAYIENNKIKCSIKDYLADYALNISYNDIFKFLRSKDILEYLVIDGKNNNYPTDTYKHWFMCEDVATSTGKKYIKLYLTETGKQGLYKVLSDNCIISNLAKAN